MAADRRTVRRSRPATARDHVGEVRHAVCEGRLAEEDPMSDGFNKAILIGNLGADAELGYTRQNRAYLKFKLATNESWKTDGGELKERTDWHRVVIWGKRGEALHKYLVKGLRVAIEGRIHYSTYEDKGGGKPRQGTDIVVDEIVLLDGPRREGRPRLEIGGNGHGSPDPAPAGGDLDDIPF
jgi:single-strand DNA-binding protein